MVSPASTSAETRSVSRTAMLWIIVPLLRTVTVPADETLDVERSMANSERSASSASPAAAAELPPPSSRMANPTAMTLPRAARKAEPEDEDGPGVSAEAVALQITFEGVEAGPVIDRGVWHDDGNGQAAGVLRRWMTPRTTRTSIAPAATKAATAAMPAIRPMVDQANVDSSNPRSVSPRNRLARWPETSS